MKIQASLVVVAISLSGCAHEVGLPDFYAAETEAKFGDAVRQNIAVQTVNPNAPTGEALTASGPRTAIAQQRYEEDDVEKPATTSTLRSATQSGSGGGSDN